MRIVVVWIE